MPNTAGKNSLPETLSWYRDGANWVVGLSTGALAAGLAYREQLQGTTWQPRAVFIVAAGAFVVAVVAGLQLYFWLITYGNQHEQRERLSSQLAAPNADKSAPNADKSTLEERLADAKKHADRALSVLGNLYYVLLLSFHVGVAGYAFTTIVLLSTTAPAKPEWSIAWPGDCPGATCSGAAPRAVVIETGLGKAWYLASDSTGATAWRPLPDLPR